MRYLLFLLIGTLVCAGAFAQTPKKKSKKPLPPKVGYYVYHDEDNDTYEYWKLPPKLPEKRGFEVVFYESNGTWGYEPITTPATEYNADWGRVKDSEYGFYIVSFGDKNLQYYVGIDEMTYKPIETSRFRLGQFYGIPGSTLKLFRKEIVDEKDVYIPIKETPFPDGAKDAIFVLDLNSSGTLTCVAYDISKSKIPQNSLGIANLSDKKLGVQVGGKKHVVSAKNVTSIPLDIPPNSGLVFSQKYGVYDLSPKSKEKEKTGTLYLEKDSRLTMVFFTFENGKSPYILKNDNFRNR